MADLGRGQRQIAQKSRFTYREDPVELTQQTRKQRGAHMADVENPARVGSQVRGNSFFDHRPWDQLRVDWRLDSSRKPVRRWSQELVDSPLERLLTQYTVEAAVAEADGGARVTLTIEQQVRGWARFAPFMMRRAAKRVADEALAGIEAAVAT